MSEVTRILDAVHQGGSKAAEEQLSLVSEELRQLAAHKQDTFQAQTAYED